MLFDTHAHLDEEVLFSDLDGVINRAREAGVAKINSVGCDWSSSRRAVCLAEQYPQTVYASVGLHPGEITDMSDTVLEDLFELAKEPVVVAWGEIGLDYHYPDPPRDIQKNFFRRQIALARELGKPIIIHDREAHQDTLDILRQEQAGINGGIFHSFSGSWEIAKICLAMGFMISFAGPLTFLNARLPVEVAAKVPLDMILVETDSPYLSPHPFRGKTNEPAKVAVTAARLAEIRNMEFERIAEITTKNAKRIFSLKD
jgi:TatD DNase family protein